MRSCPSGLWKPWDSWIWSEWAAPLAFGRVSAPPLRGVQTSGGAGPCRRADSLRTRMWKKPGPRKRGTHASGRKAEQKRGTVQAGPGGPGTAGSGVSGRLRLPLGAYAPRRRAASKRPAEPDLWGGEFRRPGGEFLSRRWERNQRIAGDAADGLRLRFAPPRSIGPLSPDPITEDAYLSGFTMVPAREA